jgi:hypothetical protein
LDKKDTPIVLSLDTLQAEILADRAPQDDNLTQFDHNLARFEMLEDVLQCCHNDLEREIVQLRAQSLTLEEVGQRIGRKKNTISEILSIIQRRYDTANLS